MAISNAYKPGWRSRRRSRLSLVERSVPRLGRVPFSEITSKPDMPSIPEKPRDSDIQTRQDHEEDFAPPTPSAPTLHASAPQQLVSDEQQDSLPSRHVEEADERSEDNEQPAARLDKDAEDVPLDDREIELETDDSSSDADDALVSSQTVDQKAVAPRVVDDVEKDEPAPSEALVLPKALQASWDIDGMSAAVKAKVDAAEIQLDWDSLIPSGLIDPRDRARPLPANMDDIARSLIRQSMSDQSSWRDRIILVSSAKETRAKSMAALNFAFALTTIDRHSVVLLDANMDGSGVGPHLDATGHQGMTTALCDSTVEIEDITLKTSLERLTLVTSGGFEDDILDRFASRRMLEILRHLTRNPQTLLVLDAPPILSSQEATVLSVIAGQVVLVVEAGVTDEKSINHALKRIGDRHNVSLVLSQSSGMASDDRDVTETPASRRLALPQPKTSMSRRRLRRAAACLLVGLAFGVSLLLGTGFLLAEHIRPSATSKDLSQRTSFEFEIKPIAPPIGSTAR